MAYEAEYEPDASAARASVGLLGVLSARQMGAERIILMSRHESRQQLGLGFGATARDFAALLPLALTLEDYAATERVSDLPRRLSTAAAPVGAEASAGDIAYYAPWGNLAVFYRSFAYSAGLVTLGRIDAGVEALQRSGSLRVTIERID